MAELSAGRLQPVYPERGGDGVWECIEVLGGSDLALPITFRTKALVKPVGEQKQNRLGGSSRTKGVPEPISERDRLHPVR
jgi:hypothetical protein